MRGRIIVNHDTLQEWVYVPPAHIYFRATETGQGKLIVVSFRSDEYHEVRGGLVSMEWWIEHSHTTLATVQVTDDMVAFAVESERLRQEEVEGITSILRTVMSDPKTDLLKTLNLNTETSADQSEEAEHAMGLRIRALLARAGGLQ